MAKAKSALRRAAALLAALCLAASMTLPVYAEGAEAADVPAVVEQTDAPATEEIDAVETPAPEEAPAETAAPTETPQAEEPTPEPTAEPTSEPQPVVVDMPTAAPTITPEITAEPTSTPEPTLTPEPTATPTPTIEPAADEEEPEDAVVALAPFAGQQNETGFTCYFIVDSGWNNYTVKINLHYPNVSTNNGWDQNDMSLVCALDSEKFLYKIELGADEVLDNTIDTLQFQRYTTTWVGETQPISSTTSLASLNGRTYTYINGVGSWSDPHTGMAGKKLYFKNASDTGLTDVKATFYDWNMGTSQWIATETQTIGDVAAGETSAAYAVIPASVSEAVRFTWTGGESVQYYYYSGEIGVDYSDMQAVTFSDKFDDCLIYNGTGNALEWGIANAHRIYFDASLSQACYERELVTNDEQYYARQAKRAYGMPGESGKLWCYLKGSGKDTLTKQPMTKVEGTRKLWYIDVPQGYTQIRFSATEIADETEAEGGESTALLTIPDETAMTDPCFFADTGDGVVYAGGNRDGYWANKDTVHDAEAAKKISTGATKDAEDVVKISSGNFETQDTKNTTYIHSTLYDYYTDYELNGQNRSYFSDGIKKDTSTGREIFVQNERNWVPFRQFNEALSDYYKAAEADGKPIKYPLYTGHFQTGTQGGKDHDETWDNKEVTGNRFPFHDVGDLNPLYGFKGYTTSNPFFAANNSVMDATGQTKNGAKDLYAYTFMGLVNNTLDPTTKSLLMTSQSDTASVLEPHFSKAFLEGQNSKNTKLGEVYEDVQFPFKKGDVFGEGVDYWYFNSAETTLYLKQNTSEATDGVPYYLEPTANTTLRGHSMNSNSGGNSYGVSNVYGFFPFNESVDNYPTSTGEKYKEAGTGDEHEKLTNLMPSRYNYGFGAKLDFNFSLTSDGRVTGKTKDSAGNEVPTKVPIRFYFSGDDDVWVYIDDTLALDIGGAHGKVSGYIDFSTAAEGYVMAYISDAKATAAGDSETSYTQEKKSSLSFRNVITDYYYSKRIDISGLTKGTHTLTMYYMERGMWESNMAVAYNFPDSNELQVEKQVDVSNVDSEFQHFFTDDTLRRFTVDIRNQATHYGTYTGDADYKDPVVATDFQAYRLKDKQNVEGAEGNILALEDENGNKTDSKTNTTVHWYAYADDHKGNSENTTDKKCSQYRYARYGQIELNKALDVKDMEYLTFQLWPRNEQAADPKNQAELVSNSKLYLQLEDSQGHVAGCGTSLIATSPANEDTYLVDLMGGTVKTYPNATWSTVKLDLTSMPGYKTLQDVKCIRIGYDYQRNIFFRNFTFGQTVTVNTKTGFTTKQWQIPDYKSAKSGQLETPVGAQYTYKGDTKDYAIDSSGQFELANGDVVTFRDQFRRGSYISLNEEVNDKLFSTRWEIYENDRLVTDIASSAETVTSNGGTPNPLRGDGTAPDDNRIEAVVNNTVEGNATKNSGYTEAHKPEGANTIVFRSYSDPDGSDQFTKLRVKFINTVKVGDLQIIKQVPDDEYDALKDTEFTFDVTFTNIGGLGLEGADGAVTKTITLKPSDKDGATLTNIPAGTEFTITERDSDDFSLKDVTVTPTGTVSGNTVHGTIVEKTTDGSGEETYNKAVFTNTARKLIDLTVEKQWKNADGSDLTDLPTSIWVKLQRRYKDDTSEDNVWEDIPDCPAVELKKDSYTGNWTHTFTGLDQYELGESGVKDKRYYEYRVVESADGTDFVGADGTIVLTTPGTGENGTDYKYTVGGDSLKIDENTGNTGTITITNQRQKPKYKLDITKRGVDGESTPVPLNGVEFTLEKLVDDKYQPVCEKKATDDKGKCSFTELEPGSYRLTEVKTAEGYNLLAAPIEFVLTDGGQCTANGTALGEVSGDAAKGYTIALTINNRKGLTLPHTGADAPSLWVLIGLPLLVAGLLVLVFRYNKKGGKRS